MPRSLYSVWCLAVALLYIAAAIYVIWDDRTHTGGGWISLNGMTSFLATFPISALFEVILGYKLDFRSNVHMGIAVLGTAACVYFVCFGAITLFQTMFSLTPPRPASK